MAAKRKRSPSLSDRYEQLKRENQRLAEDKTALHGTIRELRQLIGWTRNLNPDQQAILRDYHDALDTLALLAAATQSTPTDRIRAKSAHGAGHDPTPHWASIRLTAELHDLARRTDTIRGFTHRPTEQRSAARTCRHCRQPIDVTLRRYCDWCGQPLRREAPQSDNSPESSGNTQEE